MSTSSYPSDQVSAHVKSAASPVRIRSFQPGDADAWDKFVLAHEHGTPFHLTAWKRLIEDTYGYKPVYLIAEAGSEIQAVLPLFLVQNLVVGRALISSPFAVYGGVLACSQGTREAIKEHVEALGHELQVQYVELRNNYEEQRLGFSEITRYVTFRQSVHNDEEALLAAIPRKTRAVIRKSLKQEFEVRRTTTNLSVFENIYTANLRRLGTPCFSHAHFKRIIGYFPGMADIWEIHYKGKPAAAVLNLYFRDHVLPYYGASDPNLNAQAPSSFMYFDLMRWAGGNGFTVFDFGRSKKKSGGSHDFKAHWGMETVDLPYEMLLVRRKALPHFSPSNPAFNLPIRLWRLLPLKITRLVGPSLIRLFP